MVRNARYAGTIGVIRKVRSQYLYTNLSEYAYIDRTFYAFFLKYLSQLIRVLSSSPCVIVILLLIISLIHRP